MWNNGIYLLISVITKSIGCIMVVAVLGRLCTSNYHTSSSSSCQLCVQRWLI